MFTEFRTMKYHIHSIYNNKKIFEDNLFRSIENFQNHKISLFAKENQKNEYSNIRSYLNEILSGYGKENINFKDRPDFIIFAHQDVFFSKYFFENFENYFKNIENKESIGLIGFAGISETGETYSIMKDSDYFIFDGNILPQIVDSVDEFLFIIPIDIIMNNQIQLISIPGWHAYAAEISLILRKKDIKTYVFPIFVEHNSIRINNKGLFKTHNQIYAYYNDSIKTLAGNISEYSLYAKLSRHIFELYSSNLKFKISSFMLYKLKSFILDDLRIKFSLQRKLNTLYRGQILFILYSDKINNIPLHFTIKLKKSQIDFLQEDKINNQLIRELQNKYNRIILCNFNIRITGSKCYDNFQIITQKKFGRFHLNFTSVFN